VKNKYSCPKCGKELSETDIIRGICSNCHKFFDSLPQKTEEQKEPEWLKEKRGSEKTESQLQKVPPYPRDLTSLLIGCFVVPFGFMIVFGGIEIPFRYEEVIFPIIFVPIFIICWVVIPIYSKIMNDKGRKYWMWIIECSQCGYIGEASWGWQREICPKCSWNHVIRLGWRRRE